MIKVSIILPTYNRSHIIKRSIESILNQSYRDFELIVISNGSTDATSDVVKSIEDKRVHFICQVGSGSPAAPRNTGIKVAQGEFIAFCDDDDIWLPDKLEKQMNFFSENSQYSICCSKMKRFNRNYTWINTDEEKNGPIQSKDLLYKNTVPLSSLVLKKEVFMHYGLFDESKEIFGAEDYELTLRLSKKYQIYCLPDYLILYNSENERFSNAIAKNQLLVTLAYTRRLFYVYFVLVKKNFFGVGEVALPFLANCYQCFKILVYDFLHFRWSSK